MKIENKDDIVNTSAEKEIDEEDTVIKKEENTETSDVQAKKSEGAEFLANDEMWEDVDKDLGELLSDVQKDKGVSADVDEDGEDSLNNSER